MLAYHTHFSNLKKSPFKLTNVSIMPVYVFSERGVSTLKQRYPDVTEVHIAKNVSCSVIHYSEGMLVAQMALL